jgi:hypothetical protein
MPSSTSSGCGIFSIRTTLVLRDALGVDLDGDRPIGRVSGLGHAERGRRHPPDRDSVRRVQMIRPHHRADRDRKTLHHVDAAVPLVDEQHAKTIAPGAQFVPKTQRVARVGAASTPNEKIPGFASLTRVTLAAKTGVAPDSDQSIQQRSWENLVYPNLSVPNQLSSAFVGRLSIFSIASRSDPGGTDSLTLGFPIWRQVQ